MPMVRGEGQHGRKYIIFSCVCRPLVFFSEAANALNEPSDSFEVVHPEFEGGCLFPFPHESLPGLLTLTKNQMLSQYQVQDLHQAALLETRYRLFQHPLTPWIVEFPGPLLE